jgi:hypothetical protein
VNGQMIEQTVFKRSTGSQKAQEKMFNNILCLKGNANQNEIEIPSHISQNGYPRENK